MLQVHEKLPLCKALYSKTNFIYKKIGGEGFTIKFIYNKVFGGLTLSVENLCIVNVSFVWCKKDRWQQLVMRSIGRSFREIYAFSILGKLVLRT